MNNLNNVLMTSALFTLLLIGFAVMSPDCQAQPPGMGGPTSAEMKILKEFDKDQDGILNAAERKLARAHVEKESAGGRRRGPGRGGRMEPGKPGPKVTPDDVKNYPDAELYDPTVLRTLFLEFENDDWEKELAVFKPTDVEVPAKLTVDGKQYPNVGVSFRGASSFFRIPEGLKRSLNLSLDFVDQDQRLYGYKSMNLLNCNGDAAMMSSALYSYIAGQKIPTPKANFVKVVINGESWGIYVSSQQFNKVFVKENFGKSSGARWKVSGSPRGDGGLRYLGDDVEEYRKRFEIKSKDKQESWDALINLCRVLNETPTDQLEKELDPILDIDGALWFLAVDIALLNSDGYWTRASDYNIYQEPDGKFHILCHDMNEAFKMGRGRGGPGGPPRGGPGGGGPPRGFFPFGGPPPEDGVGRPPQDDGGRRPPGPPNGEIQGRDNPAGQGRPPERQDPRGQGPDRQQGRGNRGGGFGGGGVTLDPLTGLDNDRMPLRSRLLKVPKFQKRYLEHVKTVAQMIQWENLGPRVAQMRNLIEKEVELDTRKLSSLEAFRAATSPEKPAEGSTSLRAFAEQRSNYLLNHDKVKALK